MSKSQIQNSPDKKVGVPSKIKWVPGQTRKFRALAICPLVIIWNLVLGYWNLNLYAQDKIIAIVNNECITQKDLNDFASFVRVELSKEYKGRELQEKVETIKTDLLDKLIEDRLILQEAKKNNVKIDESRVKARINEIRKHYVTDSDFQNDLAKQGLVQADIEKKVREQLLMYNVVQQEVYDKIVVRPEEVTSFYNENLKDFVSGGEREFKVITFENEELAKAFARDLKDGQNLEDLVKKYHVSQNKMKVTKSGELRKDIEDIVFKLSPGEISGPIKNEDKYYTFKLTGITAPRQESLQEVQDEIYAFLFEKKMQARLSSWLDGLKNDAYIKIL